MAVGLAVAYLAGAFDGERTFSAPEFVTDANREGAGLALGEPLQAVGGTSEIFAVELTEGAPASEHEGEEGRGHEHGAASLVIADDSDAAIAEFTRCEGAISFICYRAANVVLRVESDDPLQLARIEAAIRGLAR